MMDKKIFTLPVKSKCGTFISFHFVNPETLSKKRFRKYVPTAVPTELRRAVLADLQEEWTVKLRNGYNPFTEAAKEAEAVKPFYVGTAVQEVCNIRTEHLRAKSASTYQSKVTIFMEWLTRNQLTKMYVADFTKENAEAFLRWLADSKGRNVSQTSRNAYLVTLRTLWRTLHDKGIAKQNPWTGIEKTKENRMGKLPLKASMKKELLAMFKKEDPELWLFVQFEYYCFIRPGELRLLKIGAIDLEDEKILIDADISKNHKSEYVVIPPPFLKVLKELKITSYKHNSYIFSIDGLPGLQPYTKDVFNRRHKVFTDKKGYNRRYSLYSWKHTGACDAAMAGANIKQLQMQLRHADLQTTDIYLKSLGIRDMGDLKAKFPSLE